MANDSYRVIRESEVELSERNQIKVQLSEKVGTGIMVVSLNKQWRDETGNWQWGKGFQMPQERAAELAQAICTVLGFDLEYGVSEE